MLWTLYFSVRQLNNDGIRLPQVFKAQGVLIFVALCVGWVVYFHTGSYCIAQTSFELVAFLLLQVLGF